jgi:hypothetical protein
MSRTISIARVLAATAAILALAVPSAVARVMPTERQQDLRHLQAGNSIPGNQRGPVYWSYQYEAADPATAQPASGGTAVPDDGAPWLIISLVGAGACAAGIAVAARRLRPQAG